MQRVCSFGKRVFSSVVRQLTNEIDQSNSLFDLKIKSRDSREQTGESGLDLEKMVQSPRQSQLKKCDFTLPEQPIPFTELTPAFYPSATGRVLQELGMNASGLDRLGERNPKAFHLEKDKIKSVLSYLQNKLQLTDPELCSFVLVYPRILSISMEYVESTFEFLKSRLKATDEEVQWLMKSNPSIIRTGFDFRFDRGLKTLYDQFKVTSSELKTMLVSNPGLLGFIEETRLIPFASFMDSKLGLGVSQIGRIIKDCPELLKQTKFGLNERMMYLVHIKITEVELREMIVKFPALLNTKSTANLRHVVNFLQATLNVDLHLVRKIITREPKVFSLSTEKQIGPNLAALRSLGFNQHETGLICVRCPAVLTRPLYDLETQRKVKYLGHVLRKRMRDLVIYPTYLTLSMDETIVPRVEFLRSLGRRDHMDWPLLKLFGGSDQEFCIRNVKTTLEKFNQFRNLKMNYSLVKFGNGGFKGRSQSVVARPRQCSGQTRAYLEPKSTLYLKTVLRELCSETERGIDSAQDTRAQIAETQVSLESTSSELVDFDQLVGRWRLIYTDARDVLPILFLGRSPLPSNGLLPWPIKVGSIYQEFSSLSEGVIKNVIKLGLDNIFEEEGVTFTVFAKYEKRGPKRIVLEFQKAEVDNLEISPFVESLIAPAIIPRTGLNHQMLLAIKEFSLSFPLGQSSPLNSVQRQSAGYLLTYLDEDLLIGRPLDQGGVFIFNRDSVLAEGNNKKKPLSKPRKLVPNVTGRNRRVIKKETRHSVPSQKRSAVFEELIEPARKDSKWEPGAGRSRHSSYKATSSVAFGATTSMPRVQSRAPIWEPKLEPEPVKMEVEDPSMELEVDELAPVKLPLQAPELQSGNVDFRDDSSKLLPEFFEKKLETNDRTGGEDTTVGKTLDLNNSSRVQPVLFQLPSVLPIPVKKDDGATEFIPGTLADLQDGEIGELLVYKSGKMKLKFGSVLLDLSTGTPTQFHQQLVAINCGEDDGHCVFLGDIHQRVICSYNIPQLLNPQDSSSFVHVKTEPKTEEEGEED
eukprot:g6731.t1